MSVYEWLRGHSTATRIIAVSGALGSTLCLVFLSYFTQKQMGAVLVLLVAVCFPLCVGLFQLDWYVQEMETLHRQSSASVDHALGAVDAANSRVESARATLRESAEVLGNLAFGITRAGEFRGANGSRVVFDSDTVGPYKTGREVCLYHKPSDSLVFIKIDDPIPVQDPTRLDEGIQVAVERDEAGAVSHLVLGFPDGLISEETVEAHEQMAEALIEDAPPEPVYANPAHRKRLDIPFPAQTPVLDAQEEQIQEVPYDAESENPNWLYEFTEALRDTVSKKKGEG